MCEIQRTSLGGGVICALCDPDCECVVCVPPERQPNVDWSQNEDGSWSQV